MEEQPDHDRAPLSARLRADIERSKASHHLDALIEDMYPVETRPPSTYGMTSDQRRAYAAHLLREGWQRWEIRARLVAPEAVDA